jgi:hypothetical protein
MRKISESRAPQIEPLHPDKASLFCNRRAYLRTAIENETGRHELAVTLNSVSRGQNV